MKEKEIVSSVLGGAFLAVGEYRHSKSEVIKWSDAKTGRAMSAPVLRHTVEFGSESVTVNERVPQDMKLEDIKVPFSKGQLVVLRVEEFTRKLGMASARGKLEEFQAATSPANTVAVGVASDVPRKP